MLCRRKCAQIMRLLEPFFPSFPHLFLAIFFARRDNQFQFRGRDRDEKNGDARRQLRVETVELRGVTLFIRVGRGAAHVGKSLNATAAVSGETTNENSGGHGLDWEREAFPKNSKKRLKLVLVCAGRRSLSLSLSLSSRPKRIITIKRTRRKCTSKERA